MGFDPISSTRIRIDRLKPLDVQAMHGYRSDPEVARYQGWQPKTLEDISDFISSQSEMVTPTPGQWFQLGIFLGDTPKLIGDCGIQILQGDPRQAEIGVTLDPRHQGQGLATECLHCLFDYLFSNLHLHRVICSIDPRNIASVRLVNNLGMRQEAHFVQSYWFKDQWADDLIFALLAHEWHPCNPPRAKHESNDSR
jgi:RimJ/RimL family protein N-acetyltransferase